MIRSFDPLPRTRSDIAVREVVDVELHDLRHARAGRVQQLEQRAVAQADQLARLGVAGFGAGGIQQPLDLVDRERLRQPPRGFGGRSRPVGSSVSMPSRARKRCSPRTEDCRRARLDAAGGGSRGRPLGGERGDERGGHRRSNRRMPRSASQPT